ncbi:cell envelope biogenesis protein TolA [Enterocloster clostridioformis]|uniref:Cell envelope biogenesis protein TolA n=1 Tax=Enterocloster clostridioformis TaxID=1531 RepID=A0A1I0K0P6_9FIRM|nr:cell envelope biogenesis protein TolA [Enterocloster clostridioformis]SEU16804.1 hypothetical protein SAMN05216521_10785 [Enterocloster clostridioformis]SEW48237.1 hypothetical protein SAMN05216528_10745 [Enterocloster clostridioformis]
MTKERIEKELSKVRLQLAQLQEREKELTEQWQMAEDARTMKIIKKHKISSEKLQLLNQISEDEILQLLAQKEKEMMQHEEQTDN